MNPLENKQESNGISGYNIPNGGCSCDACPVAQVLFPRDVLNRYWESLSREGWALVLGYHHKPGFPGILDRHKHQMSNTLGLQGAQLKS